MAAATLSFSAIPAMAMSALSLPERKLAMHNTHTGENLEIAYWEQGSYIPDAMAELNKILRDHRTNQVSNMDEKLYDLLYVLHSNLDSKQPFHIISGYRSPASNAMLASRSHGVAKTSLHMRGQAIDIRLPKCELSTLRSAALALRAGGVGFYPGSNFVHVDVGRVRAW